MLVMHVFAIGTSATRDSRCEIQTQCLYVSSVALAQDQRQFAGPLPSNKLSLFPDQ